MLGDEFNPTVMPDIRAGGLTCNRKTGSNAGHRTGALTDNRKIRQIRKKVSGTAVSQPSFFTIRRKDEDNQRRRCKKGSFSSKRI